MPITVGIQPSKLHIGLGASLTSSLLSLLFSPTSVRLVAYSPSSLLVSSALASTGGLGTLGSAVVAWNISVLGASAVGMPLPQHVGLHMLHLMPAFLHDHLEVKHLDCWLQVQQPTNLSLHLDLLGFGVSLM